MNAPQNENSMTANTDRKQILIVDDDPGLLFSLSYMLKNKYNVVTVQGGCEALEWLKDNKNSFDILITDLSMPNTSGEDIYHFISAKMPGKEKYIIFMTGGSYQSSIDEFLASINNSILEKPFSSSMLLDVINKLLLVSP
jgi:two-component system NtrC family sensor kinase